RARAASASACGPTSRPRRREAAQWSGAAASWMPPPRSFGRLSPLDWRRGRIYVIEAVLPLPSCCTNLGPGRGPRAGADMFAAHFMSCRPLARFYPGIEPTSAPEPATADHHIGGWKVEFLAPSPKGHLADVAAILTGATGIEKRIASLAIGCVEDLLVGVALPAQGVFAASLVAVGIYHGVRPSISRKTEAGGGVKAEGNRCLRFVQF